MLVKTTRIKASFKDVTQEVFTLIKVYKYYKF
jgi:hypothetical protein